MSFFTQIGACKVFADPLATGPWAGSPIEVRVDGLTALAARLDAEQARWIAEALFDAATHGSSGKTGEFEVRDAIGRLNLSATGKGSGAAAVMPPVCLGVSDRYSGSCCGFHIWISREDALNLRAALHSAADLISSAGEGEGDAKNQIPLALPTPAETRREAITSEWPAEAEAIAEAYPRQSRYVVPTEA